jgi:rhamnosyltransferase
MKRTAIYAFYDQDGIVDRYVIYLLEKLIEYIDALIIVVNGDLNEEGERLLSGLTEHVLRRDNDGFDIWAYKTGMEYLGWEKLSENDELLLINNSLMGPVLPLSEMFDTMGEKDLDFWGLSKYLYSENDFTKCNPYGYIPEHVQSFFMVFTKRFLAQKDLWDYWDNLPKLESFLEAVGRHETCFTKYFADKGYSWDVYLRTEEKRREYYLLMTDPRFAVEKLGSPFFKRTSFALNSHIDTFTNNEVIPELLSYLKEHTEYDLDMIWEHILRFLPMYVIADTMNLTYILPSDRLIGDNRPTSTALIMNLEHPDLLSEAIHYASSVPKETDIFITTSIEDYVPKIKDTFSKLQNKIELKLIPNRERDIVALLAGGRYCQ